MLGSQGKGAIEGRIFETVPEKEKEDELKSRRWKQLDLKFGKFSSTLERDRGLAGFYEHCSYSKAKESLWIALQQTPASPALSLLRLHMPKKKTCSEFSPTNSTEATNCNSLLIPTLFSTFKIGSPNLSGEG